MTDQPFEPDKVNEYFFIVMRAEGSNPQRRFTQPTVKWATYSKAFAEAERLAKEHLGATFAVMEVKSVHRAKDKGKRRRVKPKKPNP